MGGLVVNVIYFNIVNKWEKSAQKERERIARCNHRHHTSTFTYLGSLQIRICKLPKYIHINVLVCIKHNIKYATYFRYGNLC